MKSIKKNLAISAMILLGLTACKKAEVLVQPKPVQIVYTALKSWSAHASLIKKIEVNLSPADADKISKAIGGIKVTLFQDNKTIVLPTVVKVDEESDLLATYYYQWKTDRLVIYSQINKSNVIYNQKPPEEVKLGFFMLE